NGRIMVCSVAILCAACTVLILLHIHARRCGNSIAARRHILRRDRITTATAAAATTGGAVDGGLGVLAIGSLPIFIYSSKNADSRPLECAVCLSDFDDGDVGRLLPECRHSFHVDCIDMWFKSHSDCPICRAPVKAADVPDEVIVSVHRTG
ncbi:hypothetical protein M569_12396, partial [Genlisea aurea]